MPLRGIRDRSPPRLLARKADGGILTIRRGGRTKKAPPGERIGRRSGFMNSPARSLSDIDHLYCGTRSATICVLLGPKKSSIYSREYTLGFSGPAVSHLAILHRLHEGKVE